MSAAISAIVSEVIASNAEAVAQYRGGKALAFGFLVGQVMKATQGQADPRARERACSSGSWMVTAVAAARRAAGVMRTLC